MNTQLALFAEDTRSAVISECGHYRYELRQRWSPGPLIEFTMLNPSIADTETDDPTIGRIIGTHAKPAFARRWGYGAAAVQNLYAYRTTDPSVLVNIDDPTGLLNREYPASEDADRTITAWGSIPAAISWWNGYPYDWQRTAIKRRQPLYCGDSNSGGSPKHPLYAHSTCQPILWDRTPTPQHHHGGHHD